jgi:hypothetical protein
MLKASETGLIPASELALAKRDLSEDQYAQEFECSFDAAVVGSYYGKLMARAEQDRRIAPVPYDPAALVWTSWDLGIRDATAIWFAQMIGREIRIIDYYEASGVDLGHYVKEIGARPYVYAGHIVPHDAQAKELGTGKSRLEVVHSLGLKNISIAPLHRVEDGINAVRVFLPKCWFDATKCARGIDALKLYRAEYDDKLQALRPRPVHDWTSHATRSAISRSPSTVRRCKPASTAASNIRSWGWCEHRAFFCSSPTGPSYPRGGGVFVTRKQASWGDI